MEFDPETAAIRFGTGLSPRLAPPESPKAMMAALRGPDLAAQRFPIEPFSQTWDRVIEIITYRNQRKTEGALGKKAEKAFRKGLLEQRKRQAGYVLSTLARAIDSADGFRERLTYFWADHFAVAPRLGLLRQAVPTFVEEAIRPNMTGKFSDLLAAVIVQPMLLHYFDQHVSIGKNAPEARGNRGINENLARELLELHTMGVDGAYTQDDVRELAKLLTGLTFSSEPEDAGFLFRPGWAEPGAETVVGKTYSPDPSLDTIRSFLADIAIHPDTAHHLAWKLARHFVSDTPAHDLVAAVQAAYLDSGGQLGDAYAALLGHPAAWTGPDAKIKRPIDFVTSAMRALDPPVDRLLTTDRRSLMIYVIGPMRVMGQDWDLPPGPDGWPEDATAWLSPQGLAGRLQWAMTVPRVLRPDLPDPRTFLRTALGARVTPQTEFAAKGAATKWEGVGLVLASPAFQRR